MPYGLAPEASALDHSAKLSLQRYEFSTAMRALTLAALQTVSKVNYPGNSQNRAPPGSNLCKLK